MAVANHNVIRVVIENPEFRFETERRFNTEDEVKKYVETSLGSAKCEANFLKEDENGFKHHTYFMTTGLNKFLVTIIYPGVGL